MEGTQDSQAGTELGACLQETPSCDFRHPAIQDRLRSVVGDSTADAEKAQKIFYHARDTIRFALMGSGIEITASRTARVGYGDCGSKTNYQMALLRAAGIPARMRAIMAYFAALRGMIPEPFYRMTQLFTKVDFHFWPECYLSGRWVACEGLLDRALYEGALRRGLFRKEQIPTIDWDGATDLVLLEAWMVEDLGHRPSWDDWYPEFKKHVPTPGFVDKLMDRWLAPMCRRASDKVRAP